MRMAVQKGKPAVHRSVGDVAIVALGVSGVRVMRGHQFHVGVDAFGFAPIPMTLVDAWLEDLRREEEEIAAIVRDRTAMGPSTPLSEVAERLGIDLAKPDFDGRSG